MFASNPRTGTYPASYGNSLGDHIYLTSDKFEGRVRTAARRTEMALDWRIFAVLAAVCLYDGYVPICPLPGPRLPFSLAPVLPL